MYFVVMKKILKVWMNSFVNPCKSILCPDISESYLYRFYSTKALESLKRKCSRHFDGNYGQKHKKSSLNKNTHIFFCFKSFIQTNYFLFILKYFPDAPLGRSKIDKTIYFQYQSEFEECSRGSQSSQEWYFCGKLSPKCWTSNIFPKVEVKIKSDHDSCF